MLVRNRCSGVIGVAWKEREASDYGGAGQLRMLPPTCSLDNLFGEVERRAEKFGMTILG